jgi:hypothetical protein
VTELDQQANLLLGRLRSQPSFDLASMGGPCTPAETASYPAMAVLVRLADRRRS